MDSAGQLVILGWMLGISLVGFLFGRELICWYFKINENLSNQRKIINLLQRAIPNENSKDGQQNSINSDTIESSKVS
ncbi:MAG: hypothetical protein H6625_14155 [Bdellovibrionaceae bacterium]|nr:hypothetical protein [Pseudobdellovibrionaceae bacterium]